MNDLSAFLTGFFHGMGYGLLAGLVIWVIAYGVTKAAQMLDNITK